MAAAAPLEAAPQPAMPGMHAPPEAPSAQLGGAGAASLASFQSAAGGVKAALTLALRLRIEPSPLATADAAALASAGVTDPTHQAYLVWRRAALLIAALAFVPVVLIRAIGVLAADGTPGTLRALALLPVVAEGALCAILWMQLGRWTRWREQGKVVQRWWLASFLAPFVIYLYPVERVAQDLLGSPLADGNAAARLSPFFAVAYALQGTFVIGPKVLSLLPAFIRAGILTKLLFPGQSAPGWLVALGSPVAALLIYMMMFVPYQVAGSGFFLLAMLGLVGAMLVIGRAGLRLARPTSATEAQLSIQQVRTSYWISLGAGVLFALVALLRLSDQLALSSLAVITAGLALFPNVLLLTVIGADLVIANLDPHRAVSVEAQAAIADSQARLAAFGRSAPNAVETPPGAP